MNNEFKRIWKEAVVAYFSVIILFVYGPQENHEKPQEE
jgi:hypothetical protein